MNLLRIPLLLTVLAFAACGPEPSDTRSVNSNTSNRAMTYDFSDNHPWSQEPPAGLAANQVPLFISIGWDDNSVSGLNPQGPSGGMKWALELAASRTNPDGSPVRFSFYHTTQYIAQNGADAAEYVRESWNRAIAAGHEVGLHTHTHPHTGGVDPFSRDQYREELDLCIAWLTKPWSTPTDYATPRNDVGAGAEPHQLYGFRSPFLEFNNNLFPLLREMGIWYDCSLEEGWQPDIDGRSFPWPYTLDHGSPGNAHLMSWSNGEPGPRDHVTPVPGLWEMPSHPIIVPDDEIAPLYGLSPGLRDELKRRTDYFDPQSGKITGFDYNLWTEFDLSRPEFVAILKYTLDQRRAGNRAPLLFGAHTQFYSEAWNQAERASLADRQAALAEFLDYALSFPEVRVVPIKDVLDWMRNPTALN